MYVGWTVSIRSMREDEEHPIWELDTFVHFRRKGGKWSTRNGGGREEEGGD